MTLNFGLRSFAGLVVVALFGVVPAFAGSCTVTSNLDDAGSGTLRILIADPTCDPINFQPGLASPIVLTGGELAINRNLTITGPGAASLAISGNNLSRVFSIGGGITVAISGLTIQNAHPSEGEGGGIFNGGTLTLTNSTVSGNSAPASGNGGGGIYSQGTLTLTDSTVSGNSAPGGGGIYISNGTLTLTDSTLSDNSAPQDGGGIFIGSSGTVTVSNSTLSGNSSRGNGGGIVNYGKLTLNDSTFSGNSASNSGGGIFNTGNAGVTLTLTNSTLSSNRATLGYGGGICNYGPVTLTNSTVSGNSASQGGGGISNSGALTLNNSTLSGNSANSASSGGGISNYGTLKVKNTIVANSTSGGNCFRYGGLSDHATSYGHNLSDDASCTFFTATGDLTSTPAGLDPSGLKDNGGPTQTIALLATGPEVNVIPTTPTNYCTEVDGTAVDKDQRGIARPVGSGCDIGAYEFFLNSSPTVDADNSPITLNEGQDATNTGSYSDPDSIDSVSISASIGTVTKTGTNEGTWNWSLTPTDGPASSTVTITADDGKGGNSNTSFTLTVNNVAPTAVFNAPAPVDEGSAISLSLTSPWDPSAADTAAGFSYAFDCGSGYGVFSAASSASCPTVDDGSRTVKGRIQDQDGGQTEYIASVTVNNVPPTAVFVHPDSVNEGSLINLSLTGPSDPSSADSGAGFTYAFDCGDGLGYGAFGTPGAASCPTAGTSGNRTVKGTIRDKDGGESEYTGTVTVIGTVGNVAPTVTITGPSSGEVYPVNTPVLFTGSFIDPDTADTHTAQWTFDGITLLGTVTESNGSGSVTGTYSFPAPGVYQITLAVTDNHGGSGSATTVGGVTAQIVVYDPTAGFVTGGGIVSSPAGADWQNASAAGPATFGFVSKYLRGRNVPDGNLEFQFKAGSLNFKSTSMDWLVVTGEPRGQFQGTGTINGTTVCKFAVDAWDASYSDSNVSKVDAFGLKIFSCSGGGDRYSLDATPLTKGSIIIHK